ncbi:quinon protein alcohol dehydrogenase-like superfamily [Irpex rosettiformis]|uniref:Quinon protein alcohol dehydrogenase-like superfamily n=1 Tax=Irpex rosettiformis TaxID=378272 RepID=A0ACB8UIS4_9APHY|nr:quinon protein alcohol dehydrogenase-like superfamily [Irpex rosettiformis]
MSTTVASANPPPPSGYVCDTLPPPKLASSSGTRQQSRSPSPPPSLTTEFKAAAILDSQSQPHASSSSQKLPESTESFAAQLAPPGRKLCVRHQRMADEDTNLKLQQALDALPVEERGAVSAIWSNFSSSPHPQRAIILHGLLTMCCFSQLSLLSEQLSHLIRIDPFSVLPSEVSLKILGHLDATSLCRAAQVSKKWKTLADDDILWRGICEQHIGQKCLKCGWGLPILEKRRIHRQHSPRLVASPTPATEPKRKRDNDSPGQSDEPVSKRQRSEPRDILPSLSHPIPHSHTIQPDSPVPTGDHSTCLPHENDNPLLKPDEPSCTDTLTRPWKDVYCERLTIERNWRRGRCTVRTLSGHTDGVMCLQFSEFEHPAFPILITGSYDRTARVWNLETGRQIHCLTGHTRAVRALQFDAVKLITGSMDHTMKVWDWRTGKCLRTLEGHTEGVVCLNFDSNVLASGSVDTTVKVWNFRTGECFTLRGHRDWVNSVQLWNSNDTGSSCSSGESSGLLEGSLSPRGAGTSSMPCIDLGKMLFSASDDGTIRLWDLARRTCVRQFTGHVGQVQSLKLLMVDEACEEDEEIATKVEAAPSPTPTPVTGPVTFPIPSAEGYDPHAYQEDPNHAPRTKPVLISGSLDNTIKVWDLESGKASQTLFGHIEGVWAVASDKLRLVSGSHDRTVKVWAREEGRCVATLVGHRGAVTCLALGEDKIVSGSDDGDVRIWSFSG